MKYKCLMVTTSLVMYLFIVKTCYSQQLSKDDWSKLEAVSASIKQIHAEWKEDMNVKPVSGVDTEKIVAQINAREKYVGASPADTQDLISAAREAAEKVKSGYQSTETFIYEFDGKSSYATRSDESAKGVSKDYKEFDFFDGLNGITVTKPIGNTGTSHATLLRKNNLGFNHAANSVLGLFLYGFPVTRFIPRSAPAVTDIAKKIISVSTEVQIGSLPNPVSAQILIDSENWQVMKINLFDNKHTIYRTYEGFDYKIFDKGIRFPTKLSVKDYNASGKFIIDSIFMLNKVTFNNNADLSALKKGIPNGTKMIDYRFDKVPVTYEFNERLKTDDEIWEMIQTAQKSR